MCSGGCRSDFRIRLLAGVSMCLVAMVWAGCVPALQSGRRWHRTRRWDLLHLEKPLRTRWPNSKSRRSLFARSRLRPLPATLCFRPNSRASALSNRREDRGPAPDLRRCQGTEGLPQQKERRCAPAHRTHGNDRLGAVPPRSAMLQVQFRQPIARNPYERLIRLITCELADGEFKTA